MARWGGTCGDRTGVGTVCRFGECIVLQLDWLLMLEQHMDYELDRVQTTVLADEQPSLREMCVAPLARSVPC